MKTSNSPVPEPQRPPIDQQQNETAGFSQIDLLAVMVVLLVLAMFLTPTLARTRVTDQAFQCRNNLRQLIQAWRMYAEDNNGRLVPNHDGGVTSYDVDGTTSTWVDGWLDFNANNTGNTNLLYITRSKIAPYTARNTGIYRCPGDVSTCTEFGQTWSRVRSVSMNGFIEGGAYLDTHDPYSSHWYQNWWSYQKISDIQNPIPSMLFVFADEQADSINDCWFTPSVTDPTGWLDLPASYHDGAGGFSFADGHVEMHAWHDAGTMVPVKMVQNNGFPGPSPQDKPWLNQRSSAKSR